jgi:peptide methionine sulfoxide reductase MsrB
LLRSLRVFLRLSINGLTLCLLAWLGHSHLGHVFKGEGASPLASSSAGHLVLIFRTLRLMLSAVGFDNPTDERHCVNSVSMKFTK